MTCAAPELKFEGAKAFRRERRPWFPDALARLNVRQLIALARLLIGITMPLHTSTHAYTGKHVDGDSFHHVEKLVCIGRLTVSPVVNLAKQALSLANALAERCTSASSRCLEALPGLSRTRPALSQLSATAPACDAA